MRILGTREWSWRKRLDVFFFVSQHSACGVRGIVSGIHVSTGIDELCGR